MTRHGFSITIERKQNVIDAPGEWGRGKTRATYKWKAVKGNTIGIGYCKSSREARTEAKRFADKHGPPEPGRKSLSPRQSEVLEFIYRHTLDHGYQPSYVDIMEAFGFRSKNAVGDIMRALQKKGYVGIQGALRASRLVDWVARLRSAVRPTLDEMAEQLNEEIAAGRDSDSARDLAQARLLILREVDRRRTAAGAAESERR